MPIYYFEVSNGRDCCGDEDGEEYADQIAALEAATRLAEAFSRDTPELTGFAVIVSDGIGTVVGKVTIPSFKRQLQ